MWIFWFRAQNPPCRYIHGILVSLTLSGDISSLRYHLLARSVLPSTWKRTNSSADDSVHPNKDLFLFLDFEGSPEGYNTSWVSKLHQMGHLPMNLLQEPLLHGREGDLPTHSQSSSTTVPVLFSTAARQPTDKGPAATATVIPHPLSPGQGTQNQGSSFLWEGFLPICDAEEWGLDFRYFLIEWKKKRKPSCKWGAVLKLGQITVWWISWKGFLL